MLKKSLRPAFNATHVPSFQACRRASSAVPRKYKKPVKELPNDDLSVFKRTSTQLLRFSEEGHSKPSWRKRSSKRRELNRLEDIQESNKKYDSLVNESPKPLKVETTHNDIASFDITDDPVFEKLSMACADDLVPGTYYESRRCVLFIL